MDHKDVSEWSELGARLVDANEEKFAELLEAMRKIVESQELIAGFDWQLFLRSRPRKRYTA